MPRRFLLPAANRFGEPDSCPGTLFKGLGLSVIGIELLTTSALRPYSASLSKPC
jgi:hypothetical protein